MRARELWRVARADLAEAQDDATRAGDPRPRAGGLDILTDGEIRRESYSNRFATALEGMDLEQPGDGLGRAGRRTPCRASSGPIRRRGPVEVGDLRFLRANTDRPIKITLPGPFTMSQQAADEHYGDAERWR